MVLWTIVRSIQKADTQLAQEKDRQTRVKCLFLDYGDCLSKMTATPVEMGAGLPSNSDGKECACVAGDNGLNPGWKILERRKWPTQVCLPGGNPMDKDCGFAVHGL